MNRQMFHPIQLTAYAAYFYCYWLAIMDNDMALAVMTLAATCYHFKLVQYGLAMQVVQQQTHESIRHATHFRHMVEQAHDVIREQAHELQTMRQTLDTLSTTKKEQSP